MGLSKGRVVGAGLYGLLLAATAWAASFGCGAFGTAEDQAKKEYVPLVLPKNRPWKCADCHAGKATPAALDSAVTKTDEFPPNCAKCSEAAKRVVFDRKPGEKAPAPSTPGY